LYTDEELSIFNQEVYKVDPKYKDGVTYVAKPDNKLTGTEQNIVSIKTSDDVTKNIKSSLPRILTTTAIKALPLLLLQKNTHKEI